MIGSHAIEDYQRFYELLFRVKSSERGIVWHGFKEDPLNALKEILKVSLEAQYQSFETGFLLGISLAHALSANPLGMSAMLETFERTVKAVENGMH